MRTPRASRDSCASKHRLVLGLLLALGLAPGGPAPADEVVDGVAIAVDAAPPGLEPVRDATALSGRDIYRRVLANRFHSVIKDTTMRSADRAGREQVTRLRMHWQDFRDDESEPDDRGVLSKTLVKYFHPFDIRHSGYLVIHNEGRANDQFVYLPERRKVMRVSLRSEAVFGTDFSFEDILPQELQDARYQRLPDERWQKLDSFVVEAEPTELADSEYSRVRVYVDQQRFVTLRTRYWDEAGVEIKELVVDPDSIQAFNGVWVPMRLTMHHLLLGSSTSLEVTRLQPNPELPRATFALQRLEARSH